MDYKLNRWGYIMSKQPPHIYNAIMVEERRANCAQYEKRERERERVLRGGTYWGYAARVYSPAHSSTAPFGVVQ